ncbi:hypothetical protein FA09DRAFT_144701 [Tilletiopsis washingtonensis]|uniref:Uncharacterized protein n=1 Tax=Tilletiopsis washingtonensis TaxID=58919 RepID=A0A316Z2D8_9BASI|nr:hypothetical protein FA09DRAFT_144701 [Tilletiopsis washingtonensis]PWN95254.1 hypothetical protein FA09DRAFT_144701 [Tilletiopsis washingtonensis]
MLAYRFYVCRSEVRLAEPVVSRGDGTWRRSWRRGECSRVRRLNELARHCPTVAIRWHARMSRGSCIAALLAPACNGGKGMSVPSRATQAGGGGANGGCSHVCGRTA